MNSTAEAVESISLLAPDLISTFQDGNVADELVVRAVADASWFENTAAYIF